MRRCCILPPPPEPMVLNILLLWACCFKRLLTSETWTPAPRAMRLRRLPLMMEVLRRSFTVLWSMMVSTRVSWFWSIETILPEWGLVWAWRKAIQSLRLLLCSGPFDCAQGRVVGHAGVGCVARLKPGPSDCFPGRQVASLTRVVFPGLRPRL